MTQSDTRRSVIAHIRRSRRPLLVSHSNPDPDSLGSVLGLAAVFKVLGAAPVVAVHKPETVDDVLGKIPGLSQIVPLNKNLLERPPDGRCFDAVFALDTATPELLGVDDATREALLAVRPVINIDHHVPRDESYYTLSIVNIDAPSTTYMIWKYFEYLNLNTVPLEDNIAIPLYTGLLNDTGSFRYSAVDSDTHNMASHLLTSNVTPNEIFQHVYENRTIGKINLLSKMIENLKFSENGKVGYAIIDKKIFNDSGASIEDTDGLADFIRSIKGVEVSFSITSLDSTKISFRSRGEYTVNDIAQIFGGGGHYFAAGAEISESEIDQVVDKILSELHGKIK